MKGHFHPAGESMRPLPKSHCIRLSPRRTCHSHTWVLWITRLLDWQTASTRKIPGLIADFIWPKNWFYRIGIGTKPGGYDRIIIMTGDRKSLPWWAGRSFYAAFDRQASCARLYVGRRQDGNWQVSAAKCVYSFFFYRDYHGNHDVFPMQSGALR